MDDIKTIHIPILTSVKDEKKVFLRFEQLNDLLSERGITFVPGYSRYQNFCSYISLILEIQINQSVLNRSAGRKTKELNMTLQDIRGIMENGRQVRDIASSLSISTSSLYRRLQHAKKREAAGEHASQIKI